MENGKRVCIIQTDQHNLAGRSVKRLQSAAALAVNWCQSIRRPIEWPIERPVELLTAESPSKRGGLGKESKKQAHTHLSIETANLKQNQLTFLPHSIGIRRANELALLKWSPLRTLGSSDWHPLTLGHTHQLIAFDLFFDGFSYLILSQTTSLTIVSIRHPKRPKQTANCTHFIFVLYHLNDGWAFMNSSLYFRASSVYFDFCSRSIFAHHSPSIFVMLRFSRCGYFCFTTDLWRLPGRRQRDRAVSKDVDSLCHKLWRLWRDKRRIRPKKQSIHLQKIRNAFIGLFCEALQLQLASHLWADFADLDCVVDFSVETAVVSSSRALIFIGMRLSGVFGDDL